MYSSGWLPGMIISCLACRGLKVFLSLILLLFFYVPYQCDWETESLKGNFDLVSTTLIILNYNHRYFYLLFCIFFFTILSSLEIGLQLLMTVDKNSHASPHCLDEQISKQPGLLKCVCWKEHEGIVFAGGKSLEYEGSMLLDL